MYICQGTHACRILDNLPVAIPQIRDDSGSNVKRYERGFPIGRIEVCKPPSALSCQLRCFVKLQHHQSIYGMQDDGKLSLHNHLRFTILYHRDIEADLSRIVGFEVKPFSIQHKYDGTWNEDKADLSTCNPGSMKYVSDKDDPQEMKEGKEVIFTYDVVYEVSYKHSRC